MPPNTRLFDHDETTGITELYHFDPDTGGFAIESVQDIQSTLDLNKAIANDNTGKWGELAHVAHIPLVILMDLAAKGIMTAAGRVLDDKKFRAWLNDPENRSFRVKHGRV